MWDFLFAFNEYSENEGENFFVETSDLHSAWEIVADNFDLDEVEFIARYSPEEAEILGCDTY